MERWIFSRPHAVAFSLVLLGAVVVLSLPERPALRMKLLWGSVFMPLFSLAGSVDNLTSRASRSAPATTSGAPPSRGATGRWTARPAFTRR